MGAMHRCASRPAEEDPELDLGRRLRVTFKLPESSLELSAMEGDTAEHVKKAIVEAVPTLVREDSRVDLIPEDLKLYFGGLEIESSETLRDHQVEENAVLMVQVSEQRQVRMCYDGSRYEGEMADGEMEGRGVKTWPNGSTYDGEWKNGKQEGWGVKAWRVDSPGGKGIKYEGEWKNGQIEGTGAYTLADGSEYVGVSRYV